MSKTGLIGRPITRRTFTKMMGALGAAGGLGFGTTKLFREASEAEAVTTVSNALSTCAICGSHCGYIATTTGHSGWELFGNPNHPVDRVWEDEKGRLCVKGLAGPEKALNPDRVLWPMKRTNPNKGPNEDPKFVKISLEEAYELVAQNLNETIAQYGPKSVLFLSRGSVDWVRRFREALGTPNQMGHQSTCFTTHIWSNTQMLGTPGGRRTWTHDYGSSTYLLSFGHDQLGRAQNPTVQGIIKALENGAGSAVFDPRLCNTAAKALAYGGRYYAIKPGTDLAVMWAMIKWIVEEEKWDDDFVTTYVDSDDWTDFVAYVNDNGFTAGELAPAATVQEVAEWAEGKSDVPAADILAVAQELTNDGDYDDWRPNVMSHKRDGPSGPNYDNSWRAAYAVTALEILTGSVDKEGGNIIDRRFSGGDGWLGFNSVFTLPATPAMEKDEDGNNYNRIDFRNRWGRGVSGGQGSFETLFDQIVEDEPYPVRMIFNNKYNTPFVNCDTAIGIAALQKCFVVNLGYYADAGMWMADVLLPDRSSYEKTFLRPSGSVAGQSMYKFVALSEAMFSPIGGLAGYGDYFWGIAEKAEAGGGVDWPTYQEACQAYFDAQSPAWQAENTNFMVDRDVLRKYMTREGTFPGTKWSGGYLNDQRLAALAAGAPANGWHSDIDSMSAFRSQRGWAGDKTGIYPTPAEAPAFVNYAALSAGSLRLKLDTIGMADDVPGDDPPDPSGFGGWAPPRVESVNPTAGEFWMIVNREPMMVHSEAKAEPMMVELSDKGRIEMHPASAALLGIDEGDEVVITTPQIPGASETAIVRLTEQIREDTVLIPHGWGHWAVSAVGNYDADGNQTDRGFGINVSAEVGANGNTLVPALPLAEQIARRDPSCSAIMNDVKLVITKA